MPEPSTLHTLDVALRGGTVVLLLLTASLFVRDYGQSVAARLGAAFALGSAAFTVHFAPGFGTPGVWWQAPIIALSNGNTLVFWLFARALFDDAFELRRWHGLAWLALVSTVLIQFLVLVPSHLPAAAGIRFVLSLLAPGFAILAISQTLLTWRADLVEARRRLRVFIVGASAAYTLLFNLFRFLLWQDSAPALVSLANALALALVAVAIVWQLIRVAGDGLFPIAPATQPDRLGTESPADEKPKVRDAADNETINALEKLMTGERVYRQENLTISALAGKLGVLEYKLRRAINHGLGYRNFNAFLNHYRIEEVKATLANPAKADIPVLTIAMIAGFQSLGPFNRAFKLDTGLTPTEFRRLHTSPHPSESPKFPPELADSRIG